MFSSPTKPRSITIRLVVFFTLAAALVLSCGLGVFYWIVVRHAVAEDNAVFADKIRAVRAELQEPNGIATLQEELRSRRSGEPNIYWIRIIEPAGTVVSETQGMNRLLPTNIFSSPEKLTSSFQNPRNYSSSGRFFSLRTLSANLGSQSYIIQMAQERTADEQFQKQFGSLLAMVLAVGALISGLIAVTVTRSGLRPLRQMTNSLTRITPTHLDERLTPAKWPQELRPLAAAFDEMLNRLENSFTRLSQFSADLAHELRTPVANILGESQVALTRVRTADEYRAVVESTVTECERLAGIVDNLLFLARAEGADRQVQVLPFDGRAAIEKIAAYYQTLAEDRHVAIRCSGAGQVVADPSLFERALNNLVDNALRFTPDGGEILIAIETNKTQTNVSVSDNGSGIAPEHLPHVLDRFYRADASRSSGGSGLGLSLVKSIVDLHRGSVRIQSEVGRGTTVSLTFPNQAQAFAD
jgi:two-component system heavy metal sensor histidine kinase CusS